MDAWHSESIRLFFFMEFVTIIIECAAEVQSKIFETKPLLNTTKFEFNKG